MLPGPHPPGSRISGVLHAFQETGCDAFSTIQAMRMTLLTKEYPPHVYGDAGVHVEYLSRALARLEPGRNPLPVFCFGAQDFRDGDLRARGLTPDFTLP